MTNNHSLNYYTSSLFAKYKLDGFVIQCYHVISELFIRVSLQHSFIRG